MQRMAGVLARTPGCEALRSRCLAWVDSARETAAKHEQAAAEVRIATRNVGAKVEVLKVWCEQAGNESGPLRDAAAVLAIVLRTVEKEPHNEQFQKEMVRVAGLVAERAVECSAALEHDSNELLTLVERLAGCLTSEALYAEADLRKALDPGSLYESAASKVLDYLDENVPAKADNGMPNAADDASDEDLELLDSKVEQHEIKALEPLSLDGVPAPQRPETLVMSVEVVRGVGLVPSESAQGPIQAYCELHLVDTNVVHRTPTVSGSLSPVWNHAHDFIVRGGIPPLQVRVYHESDLPNDTFLGGFELAPDAKLGAFEKRWVELEAPGQKFPVSGSIEVRVGTVSLKQLMNAFRLQQLQEQAVRKMGVPRPLEVKKIRYGATPRVATLNKSRPKTSPASFGGEGSLFSTPKPPAPRPGSMQAKRLLVKAYGAPAVHNRPR